MIEAARIACPYLPQTQGALAVTHTRRFRQECGPDFYLACLELGQSQWLAGKPAQAILQLDKAMMAVLPAEHPRLEEFPIPYEAILWIIERAAHSQFLGDPVRHFQHLATRMNHKQAQPELRTARAWACLHLTEQQFPKLGFLRDHIQIEKEQVQVPSITSTLEQIKQLSPHLSEFSYLKQRFASSRR